MSADTQGQLGLFDRFAGAASKLASRAPFFAFCLLLIIVWLPTGLFLKIDTWQLIINTATTIITFLMVALLQNSQVRNDSATQDKLNAVADALSDFMGYIAERDDNDDLRHSIDELKDSVGLENRETSN